MFFFYLSIFLSILFKINLNSIDFQNFIGDLDIDLYNNSIIAIIDILPLHLMQESYLCIPDYCT